MKLSKLLSQDNVVSELQSSTREGVLAELLNVLAGAGRIRVQDTQLLLQALMAREAQGSTGFGKGVAVPHCQHAAVSKMIMAVGCSTKGVDFKALDKSPVHSIILLLSPPNDQDRHLQAMELIFRPLQRATFRKWLRQANTAKAIVDCITEAEASEAGSPAR